MQLQKASLMEQIRKRLEKSINNGMQLLQNQKKSMAKRNNYSIIFI